MKKTIIAAILSIIVMFAINPMNVKAETEWSDWSDEEPTGIVKKYETEERTVYQYRDKSHTTTTTSTNAGWTKEKDPVTTWGAWSAWQDTAVAATATRHVETTQVSAGYSYKENPGEPYPYPSNNLSRGSTGDEVRWVQKFLNDIWGGLEIDGIFGGGTQSKVIDFQGAAHLKQDGVVGNDTRTAMLDVWRNETKTENFKTQYRYQDATTTYYWYKWSDWTDWDAVEPAANDDREINTKTQYRYRLTEQSIKDVMVSGIEKSYEYTGKAYEPAAALKNDDYTLVKDEDYTVSYSDNTNAGTAKITFAGAGTYTEALEYTFEITPKDLTAAAVELEKSSYTYTGSQIAPGTKVTLDGVQLASGTDYDISYSNNSAVGTADVIINGKGNYKGTAKASFTIVAAPQKEVPQPTTDQVTTEAARQTANAGTVTLVTMDEQEETGAEAASGGNDSKVKIKKNPGSQSGGTGSSSNKVTKGTVFESKKAEYKVTDAKGKSVVYMKSNAKKASSVKVPDTIEYKNKTYKVTQIAPNAFKNNKKLTKLVIGKNVKKIGKNAFRGCKKLKSVTFGKDVVSIGAYAFYGDKKLTTINFGTKKLNKVGKAAFKNISKHPTAKVPKEKIGKYQKLIRKAL